MEAMIPCCLTFPIERQIFLREESSKLYKIVPYFLAKLFVDLVTDIFLPIIFSFIGKNFNEILIYNLFIKSILYGGNEIRSRSFLVLYTNHDCSLVHRNWSRLFWRLLLQRSRCSICSILTSNSTFHSFFWFLQE